MKDKEFMVEKIRSQYTEAKHTDLDELFLRIGALLRRAKIASSRKQEVGSFSMDMDEHIAMLGELSLGLGIVVGLAGMVMVAAAYPTYNRVLKKERERIAPEILQMTDELLK